MAASNCYYLLYLQYQPECPLEPPEAHLLPLDRFWTPKKESDEVEEWEAFQHIPVTVTLHYWYCLCCHLQPKHLLITCTECCYISGIYLIHPTIRQDSFPFFAFEVHLIRQQHPLLMNLYVRFCYYSAKSKKLCHADTSWT